jgi:hypothetical protein
VDCSFKKKKYGIFFSLTLNEDVDYSFFFFFKKKVLYFLSSMFDNFSKAVDCSFQKKKVLYIFFFND